MKTVADIKEGYTLISTGKVEDFNDLEFKRVAVADIKNGAEEFASLGKAQFCEISSKKIESAESNPIVGLLKNKEVKKLVEDLGLEVVSCGRHAVTGQRNNNNNNMTQFMLRDLKDNVR